MANLNEVSFERYAKVVMVGGDPGLIGCVQRAAPGIPGMWEIRWPGGLSCESGTGLEIISDSEACAADLAPWGEREEREALRAALGLAR